MRRVASTWRDSSMSRRMKLSRCRAWAQTLAMFSYARSSARSRPTCVGLIARFVRRSSTAIRSSTARYSSTTTCVSRSSVTPSPSTVVFVSSPSAFSRRSTGTAASSVSPAMNRAAPKRMPWLPHERPQRRAFGRPEDRFAKERVDGVGGHGLRRRGLGGRVVEPMPDDELLHRLHLVEPADRSRVRRLVEQLWALPGLASDLDERLRERVERLLGSPSPSARSSAPRARRAGSRSSADGSRSPSAASRRRARSPHARA